MTRIPQPTTTKRYHAIGNQLEENLAELSLMQKPRKLPESSVAPIIIYALSDAKAAALAAVELKIPLWIMTAPGIAGTIGPRWLKEIIAQTEAANPRVEINGIMDCGDNEGHALLALQHNIKYVRYTGSLLTAYKLNALAEKSGAQIFQNFKAVLDLKQSNDVAEDCLDWLEEIAAATAGQVSA